MENNLHFIKKLEPIYDGRKSFYNKANIYRDDRGQLLLMSYSTIVAKISDPVLTGEKKATVNGWYSCTTARHINEFLRQYGFKAMSKKEMDGEV